jgi:hypothetical protein
MITFISVYAYPDYYGGLKDSKAIIEIKEDCKKIRESAKLRTI